MFHVQSLRSRLFLNGLEIICSLGKFPFEVPQLIPVIWLYWVAESLVSKIYLEGVHLHLSCILTHFNVDCLSSRLLPATRKLHLLAYPITKLNILISREMKVWEVSCKMCYSVAQVPNRAKASTVFSLCLFELYSWQICRAVSTLRVYKNRKKSVLVN